MFCTCGPPPSQNSLASTSVVILRDAISHLELPNPQGICSFHLTNASSIGEEYQANELGSPSFFIE
jgi:hypothetical protein